MLAAVRKCTAIAAETDYRGFVSMKTLNSHTSELKLASWETDIQAPKAEDIQIHLRRNISDCLNIGDLNDESSLITEKFLCFHYIGRCYMVQKGIRTSKKYLRQMHQGRIRPRRSLIFKINIVR